VCDNTGWKVSGAEVNGLDAGDEDLERRFQR
jgi:hypothetical protein